MAAQKRTYQDPAGPYQLPNDGPEHDRLDGQSASLVALMDNKPFQAPLTSPKRILDIGCGTGAMTVILARLYPDAEVIGVDIAPVSPNRHGQTPSNVTFIQSDIRHLIRNQDSRFHPASFDYIFERLLLMGITDWPGHLSAISTLLKPNAWLECHEFAWTLYSTSGEPVLDALESYSTLVAETSTVGLNVNIGRELADTFRSIGPFAEVKEVIYEFSPKERADRPDLIGLERPILDFFKLMITKLCSGRRSEEDIKKYQDEMDDMWHSKLDGTERHRMHVVIGQKK